MKVFEVFLQYERTAAIFSTFEAARAWVRTRRANDYVIEGWELDNPDYEGRIEEFVGGPETPPEMIA